MTALPETPPIARFTAALPFWMSIGLIPLAFLCAANGGWWLALMFVSTWYLFTILDYFTGLNTENADPQTPDDQLYWYRLITLLWAPLQVFTIIALLWYTATTDHLSGWEEWLLFCGVGVISGTIGINYAHELMHQNVCWSHAGFRRSTQKRRCSPARNALGQTFQTRSSAIGPCKPRS